MLYVQVYNVSPYTLFISIYVEHCIYIYHYLSSYIYIFITIYQYICWHCSQDSISQTKLRFNFNQEQNNMKDIREIRNGVSQESASKA